MNRLITQIIFVGILAFPLFCFCSKSYAQEIENFTINDKIQIIADHIERKYKINVIYQGIPPMTSSKYLYQEASPEDLPQLFDYVKIFYEELLKYPKTFFIDKDIRSIVFVKKLFFNAKPAEGLFSYNDKRIFFDFLRNGGNVLSKRHSIHHEFYHMMDVMQPGWRNPLWDTFNEPEFVYGEESLRNIEQGRGKTYKIFRERQGFITPYSMKSAEEDKAEIYACLMIQSQNHILNRWIKEDPILRKKTEYIKSRIQEFCPYMNEQYWDNLSK